LTVAHLASPGPLHHDAIEIWVFAFDAPVPPSVDLGVDLLKILYVIRSPVSASLQLFRPRHGCEAERLGGPEVDHQFSLTTVPGSLTQVKAFIVWSS
jgi:hypothetical protein